MQFFTLRVASNKEDQVREKLARKVKIEALEDYVGRILCVETAGYHRDIGTPESLRRAIADTASARRHRASVA